MRKLVYWKGKEITRHQRVSFAIISIFIHVKIFYLVRNYELDRSQIVLSAKIGVGQFGDVYVGTYRFPVLGKVNVKRNESPDTKYEEIQVAVKTCKANEDPEKTENFLAEACKYIAFELSKNLKNKKQNKS